MIAPTCQTFGSCSRRCFFTSVALVQVCFLWGVAWAGLPTLWHVAACAAIVLWGLMIYFADHGQRRCRLLGTAAVMALLAMVPHTLWVAYLSDHGHGLYWLTLVQDPMFVKTQLLGWPLTWVLLAYHRAVHDKGCGHVSFGAWQESFWQIVGQKLFWLLSLVAGGVALFALVNQLGQQGFSELAVGLVSGLGMSTLGVGFAALLLGWVQEQPLLVDSLSHLAKSLARVILIVGSVLAVARVGVWLAASISHGHLCELPLTGIWVLALLMGLCMQVVVDEHQPLMDWDECQRGLLVAGVGALVSLLAGAVAQLAFQWQFELLGQMCQAGFWLTGLHRYNIFETAVTLFALIWLTGQWRWLLSVKREPSSWWRLNKAVFVLYVLLVVVFNPWVLQGFSAKEAQTRIKPFCQAPAVAQPSPVAAKGPKATPAPVVKKVVKPSAVLKTSPPKAKQAPETKRPEPMPEPKQPQAPQAVRV